MICRDTPTHGCVCGWMGCSVGQWVGSGQNSKSSPNQYNSPNQDNSVLFEELLFVEAPHPWMGGSVGQWVGSGHITKYPIILDLR